MGGTFLNPTNAVASLALATLDNQLLSHNGVTKACGDESRMNSGLTARTFTQCDSPAGPINTLRLVGHKVSGTLGTLSYFPTS
jgi:hypothetical protein